ncbi:Maf family protein [Rhodanobacter aciditrophus]|uniref:7-methyl-GTP pyrophosphatase n=1 Tax=Rhodanobacter aciditrophus TaxID=1623218 RepID=A0ABW4B1V7_9GAMM
MTHKLVLASSSTYRAALLKRLGLEFQCTAPNIDETSLHNEGIDDYIERLSVAKAKAVAVTLKEPSIIIASDQSATFEENIIGKPHTRQNAIEQLSAFSGKSVTFKTGVCVFNTLTSEYEYERVDYSVTFRDLTLEDIANYVDKDSPLDCAGSFKSEKLGIALFSSMSGDDPTALEGLPLITTCKLLRNQGIDPLSI